MARMNFVAWALALIGIMALTGAALAQSENPAETVDAARNLASLISAVLSIGAVAYVWLTAGSSKNAETLTNHDTRLTNHAERLTKLEGEVQHMPGRDTAHRLELAIEALNGRLATLDERLKPVASIYERMQELLLEQAKK